MKQNVNSMGKIMSGIMSSLHRKFFFFLDFIPDPIFIFKVQIIALVVLTA